MVTIELRDQTDQLVWGKYDHDKDYQAYQASGAELAVLAIKDYCYQAGDQVVITTEQSGQYLIVQLDETLAPTLIYLAKKKWCYALPITPDAKKALVETSFSAKRHHLMVRKAHLFEIYNYQNLAFNSHDQKKGLGAYPHASANVETRDEVVFFAKNAIDGKYGNRSHGSYPFTSWGINQQAEAQLVIEFGRIVEINWVRLLFRADFPHDSYWTEVTLEFSDGDRLQVTTTNTESFQEITFPAKKTTQLTLKKLQKASDRSPFPALTQIEVFGWNESESNQIVKRSSYDTSRN